MTLPAFDIPADDWSGASRMLLQIPVGNTDYMFSLKMPIRQFGPNYVVTIAWEENGATSRYKLWEDVGEDLHYPVYSGERIGLNAIFEVWSTDTTASYSNPIARTFETSILLFTPQPGCFCVNPSSEIILTALDPTSITEFPNPFEGQDEETDPEAPGGGIPTTDQLGSQYADYWVFPCSGYGKEANGNVDYPNNITAEEADFWHLLLDNEWPVLEYSDRVLAWLFLNHITNLYDFDQRYATGIPTPSTEDNFIEFAAPWVLTYLWKP